MSRSVSYITRSVIIATVAALAAGCAAGPPVMVEDRTIPAAPLKLTGKAAQPATQTSHSGTSEVSRHLLLHWEIRKEGK